MSRLGDLTDLARRLADALEGEGVPYALSGALALAAHGVVRATKDIDVLVSVPNVRLPRVIEILRALGCEADPRSVIAEIRDRYAAALQCGQVTVELFVPAIPFHQGVVERAVTLPFAGRGAKFVTAEDLIVLKMIFHRTKDLADVKALLAGLGEALDREAIARTLEAILPAEDPRHGELRSLIPRKP